MDITYKTFHKGYGNSLGHKGAGKRACSKLRRRINKNIVRCWQKFVPLSE